jgi:hypothetical protein
MSAEAVRAKTGKTWDEWFVILDKEKAAGWTHPQIATWLHEHGVPDWWCQMVTVEYERARGMRAMHETSDGFAVSASRTFAVPLADLFAAWQDGPRQRWLPEAVVVRKATPTKTMRIGWPGGKQIVAVGFYDKGGGKSQVTIQHSKLADANEVAEKRALWKAALDKLGETLE